VKVVSGSINGVQGPVRDIVIDPELMDVTVPADEQVLSVDVQNIREWKPVPGTAGQDLQNVVSVAMLGAVLFTVAAPASANVQQARNVAEFCASWQRVCNAPSRVEGGGSPPVSLAAWLLTTPSSVPGGTVSGRRSAERSVASKSSGDHCLSTIS
jgi:hypothetical protein